MGSPMQQNALLGTMALPLKSLKWRLPTSTILLPNKLVRAAALPIPMSWIEPTTLVRSRATLAKRGGPCEEHQSFERLLYLLDNVVSHK